MKTILYLTDLYYKASARNYYEEDLFITSKLKEHFNLLIGNPQQAISYTDTVDLIVFRNTGPVLGYYDYFQKFLEAVKQKNLISFNSFDGKADIKGKQYLLDLYKLDFPVIPTIEHLSELDSLGNPKKYMLKLKNGADSIGMQMLSKDELIGADLTEKIIQPFVDFNYEISFYYINDKFQYALHAPDKTKRWVLKEIEATPEDLKFAEKFLKWNNMTHGITRVDACRLEDNSLLLVELEDLNPFLSLDLLSEAKRNAFIDYLIEILKNL